MSFRSLSGQFMVISSSAFISIAPVFAAGLISAKAMNTMNAKPITTLNSISVNGTNVPSSGLPRGSSSSMGSTLKRGDDVHLGHLGDLVEQFHDAGGQKEILKLQQKSRGDTRHGDVKCNRHASAHPRQGLAQSLGIEGVESSHRDQHQDETNRCAKKRQPQQSL